MYYDKPQINIGKALGKRVKDLPGAWPMAGPEGVFPLYLKFLCHTP